MSAIYTTRVRERLIFLFNLNLRNHIQKTGKKYSVREFLSDICYHEHNIDYLGRSADECDDLPYDAFFPLKDDSMRRLLDRRQTVVSKSAIPLIINFLSAHKLIEARAAAIVRPDAFRFLPLRPTRTVSIDNTILDGEYVYIDYESRWSRIQSFVLATDTRANYRCCYIGERIVPDVSQPLNSNINYINANSKLIASREYIGYLCQEDSGQAIIILFSSPLKDVRVVNLKTDFLKPGIIELDMFSCQMELLGQCTEGMNDVLATLAADFEHRQRGRYWDSFALLMRNDDRINVDELKEKRPINDGGEAQDQSYQDSTQTCLDNRLLKGVTNNEYFLAIRALIDGADINLRMGSEQDTVLHIAARDGKFLMLDFLSGEWPEVIDAFPKDPSFAKELAALSDAELYKLKSILSHAPICIKNSQGLLPSALIGPVDPAPTDISAQKVHNAFIRALRREFSAAKMSIADFIDFLFDNKSKMSPFEFVADWSSKGRS